MEVVASSVNASFSLHCFHNTPTPTFSIPQVLYPFLTPLFISSAFSSLYLIHFYFSSPYSAWFPRKSEKITQINNFECYPLLLLNFLMSQFRGWWWMRRSWLFSLNCMYYLQVSQWKGFSVRIIESQVSLKHRKRIVVGFTNRDYGNEFSLGVAPWISKTCFPQCTLFPSTWGFLVKRRKYNSLLRLKDCSVNFRKHASVLFVLLVMSVSLASSKPSCEFDL